MARVEIFKDTSVLVNGPIEKLNLDRFGQDGVDYFLIGDKAVSVPFWMMLDFDLDLNEYKLVIDSQIDVYYLSATRFRR